jgi:hypothetical protein
MFTADDKKHFTFVIGRDISAAFNTINYIHNASQELAISSPSSLTSLNSKDYEGMPRNVL